MFVAYFAQYFFPADARIGIYEIDKLMPRQLAAGQII
jgi:hypothetical protein